MEAEVTPTASCTAKAQATLNRGPELLSLRCIITSVVRLFLISKDSHNLVISRIKLNHVCEIKEEVHRLVHRRKVLRGV